MTAVKDPPHEPYATESGDPPPPEVLNLWNEVGVLMDKSAQGTIHSVAVHLSRR
jgi:hypothetical protein